MCSLKWNWPGSEMGVKTDWLTVAGGGVKNS